MNEWQYVFTSLTHIFSLFNVILISQLFCCIYSGVR